MFELNGKNKVPNLFLGPTVFIKNILYNVVGWDMTKVKVGTEVAWSILFGMISVSIIFINFSS